MSMNSRPLAALPACTSKAWISAKSPKKRGGISGFYEWLAAIADPKHEGHAEAKEWADEYDPDAVDELPIKYALSRIANRRNAARVRIAKNS
jgi:hypothetical protein